MFKKILVIIVSLFLIATLVSGWFLKDFFLEKINNKEIFSINNKEILNETQDNNSTQPRVFKERDILAKGEIRLAFLKDEKEIVYYNRNNFLSLDPKNKNIKNLGTYPLDRMIFARCSSQKLNCLVFIDGQFLVHKIETGEQFRLNEKVKEAFLNPQGDGLIYLYQTAENNYELYNSDLKGNNRVKIKSIAMKNLRMRVSHDGDRIIYYSTKENQENSGIFVSSLINKNQDQKIISRDIIDASWSPDGKKILFSFYDHSVSPKRVQLGYFDLNQNKEYNLGIPSISEKCVWASFFDYLYCGTLTSEEQGSFTLEDWYNGSFISNDSFWRIDLENGKKKRVFDSEEYPKVDSFNLILLEDGVVFIDKISGNLIKRKF